MTEFKPARPVRTNVLCGLGGVSGSGKTYSALTLATGMGGKIAVIDTERGRALHYARDFAFDHATLEPPFTPARHIEMIQKAGSHVGHDGIVILDSMSHEWEGDGGLRDWAAKRQEEFAKRFKGKPDAYTLMAWSEPKLSHQKLVNYITRVDFHLILCFRAREKVKMVDITDDDGRTTRKVIPAGIRPISEKDFAFEVTFFGVMSPEDPGVPEWTFKSLMRGLWPVFPEGERIDVETGKRLARWAAGEPLKEPEMPNFWVDKTGAQVGPNHERISEALDLFEKEWNIDKDRMSHHRNLKLLDMYIRKTPEGRVRNVVEAWHSEMAKILDEDLKK